MKKAVFVCASVAALAASAAVPFKIGIAGYTFHRKSLDESLSIMRKIDCRYLCHKDFFVGYGASGDKIAQYVSKTEKAGVKTLATGPLYANNEAALREQFEFAKKLGLKVVVGVPFEMRKKAGGKGEERVESDAVLDIVDRLVKEYDIFYAIHNHGPDIPKLFPTASSAIKRIGSRDRRIGVCLDIGHERRAGHDPVKFIKEHGERIFDVHIKNIKIDSVRNIAKEGPRGELDIPAVFQALADVGYTGVCHIEYEKDFSDNAMGLAESFGYYRGVADCIKAKAVMKSAPEGANTLTAAEKAEGWELLWDGKTFNGWVGVKEGFKAPPAKGWVIKDGTLTMLPVSGIAPDGRRFELPPEDKKLGGGGDIVTVAKFRDFAFKFDFRLTAAANSGVKYFYDEKVNRASCEEYQILENGHPDSTKGRDGNRKAASLYDIFPANADGILKGIGEWNTGMVVSKGSKVEHWLNGVKVLEYDRASKAFKEGVNKSKYASWGVSADGKSQPWGEIPEGRILLQDHSDSTVSFCNLKVKKLR